MTGCIEHQAAKTANSSTWEVTDELDYPLSLPDLEADWSHSMDPFSLDGLLNMPFEEPQPLHKETWPETRVGRSEESSRETLSALPGLGSLTPSDHLQEIDQRLVTHDPQSNSLADQQ